MDKKIHIVSFNVPYPADYGGVIDVFYRILALQRLGVEVHLHAFTYGREASPELENCCASVTYYKRRTGILAALSPLPYIVKSRQNSLLARNLSRDNAPVLLEGLHCCSLLDVLDGRKLFVRAHNVEHEYYSRLADVEKNPLRRFYFRTEARRLQRYERVMRKADAILAVTENDAAHFRAIGCGNVLLMPSSHRDDIVVSKTGTGDYALYHADLSVGENIKAVDFLFDNIICRCGHRFVIAGRNPSQQMRERLAALPNVTLVANPDDASMHQLIADAQVQILVTDLPVGLKLKLLNSLYGGRHCLVNSAMVAGTHLGEVCTVADDADTMLNDLNRLMQTPFTDSDIEHRRRLLGDLYSNESNARILLSQL